MQLNKSCEACNTCLTPQFSIFSCLSGDETEQLKKEHTDLRFKYGELIFKERQMPGGIYVITKGKVKVSKSGFEDREQIVRFAKENDLLGYRALLSNDRFTCSATAISDTEVCFFSKDLIFRLIENNSKLALRFIKLLADDTRNAEEKAMHMAQKTVRERVAESILILKEVYGFTEDGNTINANLKRNELAGLAGTVRETATRLLSELNADKIISTEGNKIKILDLKELEKNANPLY